MKQDLHSLDYPLPLVIPPMGVISSTGWVVGPDGSLYQYIFADDWRVVTDKEVGKVMGGDRWFAVAFVDHKPICIIPGCRVEGFCAIRPTFFSKMILDLPAQVACQ